MTVHDITEGKQHLAAEAKCLACGEEWVAVAEQCEDIVGLECPACHTMRGVFNHNFAPDEAIVCVCGSMHFCVTPNWVLVCLACGSLIRYED